MTTVISRRGKRETVIQLASIPAFHGSATQQLPGREPAWCSADIFLNVVNGGRFHSEATLGRRREAWKQVGILSGGDWWGMQIS
jgi:hypothetical protein